MKQITIYQASDGHRFDDERSCRDYEQLCERVKAAMAPMGPTPKLDGDHFHLHSPQDYIAAKTAIVEICREIWPTERIFQYEPMMIHPHSYAGRFLDDCASRPIRDAWYRFEKTNERTFREFEQPYYALQEQRKMDEATGSAVPS